MPYELDPGFLVRIWFSNDPDKAINFENKQRLINLRVQNPDTTISLVYAKKLLSESAIMKLHNFCRQYKITLVSMEEDVIPYCLSPEEKNLVSIYEQEINAVNDGGSLAAASDIVRWLKAVYSRGIYSDFDTQIHTIGLTEKISVEAPILLNIGSVEFPIKGLPQPSDLEAISLNNDMIAVIGDDAQTHEIIKNIQCAIYDAYQNPKIYSQFYYQLGIDVSRYVCQQLGASEGFRVASTYILSDPNAILSDQLFKRMADPISIRKQLLEENKLGDMAFCRRQLKLIVPGLFLTQDDNSVKATYLSFLSQAYGRTANETDIKSEREGQFNKLYIASVTHASGPGRLMLSLFGNVALSASDINKKVMPYSFFYYEKLNKSFSSTSNRAAHTAHNEYLKQIVEQGTRISSDQSWTEQGRQQVVEREKHLATVTLQRFFRERTVKRRDLRQEISSIENCASNDKNKSLS